MLNNRMNKYVCTFPFVRDLGSVSPVTLTDSKYETKRQCAINYLNKMRDYDGLPHKKTLPRGTKFVKIV